MFACSRPRALYQNIARDTLELSKLVIWLQTLGPCLQARAIVDGLPGDIVALALPLDIMKIAEAGLIDADWQARQQLEEAG